MSPTNRRINTTFKKSLLHVLTFFGFAFLLVGLSFLQHCGIRIVNARSLNGTRSSSTSSSAEHHRETTIAQKQRQTDFEISNSLSSTWKNSTDDKSSSTDNITADDKLEQTAQKTPLSMNRSPVNKNDAFLYSVAQQKESSSVDSEKQQQTSSAASSRDEQEENVDKPMENFRESSKKAFLALNPRTRAKPPPPIPVDEERRKIWLARTKHQQHKTQATKQKHEHTRNGAVGDESAEEMIAEKPIMKLDPQTIGNQTCTSSVFKHKVRLLGCETKTIKNRFCHGSCNSFFIPQLRPKKLKATFRSCSACVPTDHELVQVKLNCPERSESEIYRTVILIKKCACRNVEHTPAFEEDALEE